jgi:hypothetical protein
VFFGWLASEGERENPNPMDRVEAPKVTKKAKAFFTDDELTRLLKTCSGATCTDRRDTAKAENTRERQRPLVPAIEGNLQAVAERRPYRFRASAGQHGSVDHERLPQTQPLAERGHDCEFGQFVVLERTSTTCLSGGHGEFRKVAGCEK